MMKKLDDVKWEMIEEWARTRKAPKHAAWMHDGSHRQVGWDLDLKGDMIIVHVGRVDVERRVLFDDGVTGGKKFTLYIVFEIFASVARTPDEVVLSLVDRVVETAGSHGTSLAREYPC